ncbi:MAG: hypothetical protein GX625_13325 [Clostridiaceae bacterium]|nr:hypothetical protein [Clostridiaceae bacterium]
MALHLHDNDGTDDQHLIPGDGLIDWSVVIKKLCETNYPGAIALEVSNEFSKNIDDKDAKVFLKRAYEAARRLVLMEAST